MTWRHLEGPKNPDGPNLGIYIFMYVYKVHMCMYMLGGGIRFHVVARRWDKLLDELLFSTTYFFCRKRKAKDVNAKPLIISNLK